MYGDRIAQLKKEFGMADNKINIDIANEAERIVKAQHDKEIAEIESYRKALQASQNKGREINIEGDDISKLKQNAALQEIILEQEYQASVKKADKDIENADRLRLAKNLINAKYVQDLQNIHDKEQEEEKKLLNEKAKLLAEKGKTMAEIAIEMADVESNGQEKNYSAKRQALIDYYTKIIALTKDSEEKLLLIKKQAQELQKLDKENNKDISQKYENEITESERHELAMIDITKKSSDDQKAIEAKKINIQIAAENDKYNRLVVLDLATEAETKKHNDKIEELTAQLTKAIDDDWKQKALKAVEYTAQIVDAIVAGMQKVLEAEAKTTDTQIGLQQRRIDELTRNQLNYANNVYTIAEQGNAQLLELEKERLDNLNKQKQQFVRQQQELAVIELVANTAVMITKAAAEGGAGAAITIAAAVLALIAGLASARSIAGQAAYYEGGYTGDGNPKQESNAIGTKPYIYHKKEFIFNHQTTEKHLDIFRKVHNGEIDLNQLKFESDMYKTLRMSGIDTSRDIVYNPSSNMQQIDINGLKVQMSEVVKAIESQPGMTVKIDEHGIFVITNKFYRNQERINNLTR